VPHAECKCAEGNKMIDNQEKRNIIDRRSKN